MVMATPSPQQVGREFVRQYYTVLHEAPEVLHRFYSSGSTFVHGGIDKPGLTEDPVVGQLEIDKKIKTLSFKDCHTKIRQVDSQSTIGNGVVVQVTGELSNNGEPMRRFMQTFVLAPQTPKKFYVHNDIFRYQDEVYQDNSETESEDPQQVEISSSALTTKTLSYYHQNDCIEQNEINRQETSPMLSQHETKENSITTELTINNKDADMIINGHLNASIESKLKIHFFLLVKILNVDFI
jgi:Ras GTPase-activating protein-binding protein 1